MVFSRGAGYSISRTTRQTAKFGALQRTTGVVDIAGPMRRVATTSAPQVDVNVPRFNQTMVAVLTGIAFLAELPWLVVVVALILSSTYLLGPRFGVFTQIYVRWIRPSVDPTPDEFEDARPPRFAQLVGSVFLLAATAAFVVSWHAVGWVLTLIVAALAALAATTRICVGCIIYEKAVLENGRTA